jgi:hypothetical protein
MKHYRKFAGVLARGGIFQPNLEIGLPVEGGGQSDFEAALVADSFEKRKGIFAHTEKTVEKVAEFLSPFLDCLVTRDFRRRIFPITARKLH